MQQYMCENSITGLYILSYTHVMQTQKPSSLCLSSQTQAAPPIYGSGDDLHLLYVSTRDGKPLQMDFLHPQSRIQGVTAFVSQTIREITCLVYRQQTSPNLLTFLVFVLYSPRLAHCL